MSSWCRLAILTDEVSQDLDTALRFVRECGLDGVEIRSVFGKAFKNLSVAEIDEIARRCSDAGVAVSGVATPVFKCDLDAPTDIAAHVEIFRRSLDAARTLGCEVVRVFTFLRRSHPATGADLERAASHFPALLELVRGSDLRIGVENEASCVVGTGAEMREFLGHLPVDPQIGVVWDPCNVLYLEGENDPVRDDYPLVAGRTIHVHVKDARREGAKPAKTCLELGTGGVEFPAQFSALRAAGYRDWVTLETHWRATPLDEASQHLPAGEKFSANAEPASRICVAHLQRFIGAA